MSVALEQWLADMSRRYAHEFSEFEVFVFEGTEAEIIPSIFAWHRPEGMRIFHLNIAQVCDDVDSVGDARRCVEAELAKIASEHENAIVVVSGVHLLPILFPQGPLQPIFAHLRSGGRVVMLVAPPPAGIALPEAAHLDDWRSLIRTHLGGSSDEKLILGGGTH